LTPRSYRGSFPPQSTAAPFVHGDGVSTRDFMYVDTLTGIICAAIDRGRPSFFAGWSRRSLAVEHGALYGGAGTKHDSGRTGA